MKKVLRNTIIDAVLFILLGIALLIWPMQVLDIIYRVIGVLLAVTGLIKVIAFFAQKDKKERSVPNLLLGCVQIVLAIVMLVKPSLFEAIGPVVAAVMIGYGALLGLIRSIGMLRAKQTKLGIAVLVLSLVTLVLAIVVLINPVAFATFHVLMIGVSLILDGITLLIASLHKSKQ